MPKSQFTTVFRHIRKAIGLAGAEELPDAQLLDRFVLRQDDTAFEQLIQRYGPMVLGACRRILVDPNDADDAFQATFLVLVRRAATLDQRAPLGSWLYGVALRVALKSRAAAARRRERTKQASIMSPDDPTADLAGNEVRSVLDEELQQLPEKFRAPLILCYLVGKTNQEAARELGCPPGSMGWRLDRARTLLRDRLVRRGIGLPAVALAGLLGEQTQAAVPVPLAAATLQNAALLVAGLALPAAQAHVLNLAEGVLRTMLIQKLMRTVAVMSFLIALIAVPLGAAGFQWLAAAPQDNQAGQGPVIRSAKSGPWSAATSWEGGQVPGAGARVLIREGHRIVYDVKTERPVRGINIAGTLAFAADKDTRLDVGLIKIQAGDEYTEEGFDCEAHVLPPAADKPLPALEVGTPNNPIDAKYTALIRLVYQDGMNKESCPAIVCCGGRMDLHGAPLSHAWVKLGDTAKKGDTVVSMAEAVTGWRVGDRVIVTPTARLYRKESMIEERVVKAIEGTKVTLDRALDNDHLGIGDYRGELANLSRNVIVESADPQGERGHTMYHRYSAGAISYAEFRHLGKEGVLGRYSLHYHLVGDTMRGSYVIGASIWDSGNRWLTIHGTNYLVVRDNVGYRSVGHGFFLEDGTEVYNVLDRNLAVAARRGKRLPKQMLPFDDNGGAGFWWSNSLNTFTRNVAVENGNYGYRFEATPSSNFSLVLPVQQPDGSKKDIDIRTLPFIRFDDNEVHSNVGLYGFNLGEGVKRVGPDTKHPFIVRNMKIWDTHYGFRPQVPSLLVENMKLFKVAYGVYHPNYDNHVYRDLYIGQTNTEPFNRGHDDDSVQHGVLAVDGLTFDNCGRSKPPGTGMPLIQISDDNSSGTAESHFRNVKVVNHGPGNSRVLVNRGGGPRPTPKTSTGVPIYFHDHYGPGRHAKIVSAAAKDFGKDGAVYREDYPLTGDESRMAEVKDVAFPKLLDPVDDLPPITVVTHIRRLDGGKVAVRGTTSDNGPVKIVRVNGKTVRALSENFAEWAIVLEGVPPGPLKLEAYAEDIAGNVEKRPHVLVVP